MRLSKLVLVCFSFLSIAALAQRTKSFIVEIGTPQIKVLSPEKQTSGDISISISNKTNESVYGKILSGTQTLSQFRINSNDKKIIDVKSTSKLMMRLISPPFQDVPLQFSKDPYAIPE